MRTVEVPTPWGGGLTLWGMLVCAVVGCYESPNIADNRCVPGRARPCACPGGESGRRVCGPQGRWGDCECRNRAADTGREPMDTEADEVADLDVEPTEDVSDGEASEVSDIVEVGDTADTAEADGGDPDSLQCPTPRSVSGQTFYVSPDGTSDAAGTANDPLDVDTANAEAGPGDEVVFLAGAYTDGVDPSNSGNAGAPIVYRARNRHQARFEGNGINSVAIRLEQVEHVHIRGFALDTGEERWARIKDASDIILRDLAVVGEHTGVGLPMLVQSSDDVALLDSELRRTDKYVGVAFRDVQRAKIAGNVFGVTDRVPLEVEDSRAVVMRGNVFHNPAGPGFRVEATERVLVEDNLLANSVDGPGVNRGRSSLLGDHVIARFNRFVWNWTTPLWSSSHDELDAVDIYAYRNVFDRVVSHSALDGAGYRVRERSGPFEGIVIKNNVFSRLGQNAARDHLWVQGLEEQNGDRVTRNAIWAGAGETAKVSVDWKQYGVSAADGMFEYFEDNREVEPGYRGIERLDHRPASGSPLIDQGAPLTRAASAGSGTSLPVDDAKGLFDGWQIPDEDADRIAVGTSDEVVELEDVDYQSDTLKLANAIEWDEGDRVAFPWSGAGPDIGFRERGATGRRTVGIEQSTFVGKVGEPVAFRIVEHGGVEAATARWEFGDRTTGCAAEVEHTYEEPGAYPVRLRVGDRSGEVHRATALVLVNGNGERVDTVGYNRRVIDRVVCDGGSDFGDNVERGSDGEFKCVE